MLSFDGDPKLYLDENGADLKFENGQPDMDMGVENAIWISLFTRQGWPGNIFLESPEEQIGSDFLSALQQPITLTSLNNIEKAAKKSLSDSFFGDVTVTVTNPVSHYLKIKIELPGQALTVLLTTKNGLNWQYQTQRRGT